MKKVTVRKRLEPLRTVTWNLAGLAEDSLEPFLACARMTMLWDAMLLQETFRKLRFSVLKTGGTWDHAPSLQSSRQKSKRERHLSPSFRHALVLFWRTRGVERTWSARSHRNLGTGAVHFCVRSRCSVLVVSE